MFVPTSHWARKFKKVVEKNLVKSNKSFFFFVKLHFWQFLNFSPRSKIDFGPFLKLQKVEFGQKKIFVKWIYLTS